MAWSLSRCWRTLGKQIDTPFCRESVKWDILSLLSFAYQRGHPNSGKVEECKVPEDAGCVVESRWWKKCFWLRGYGCRWTAACVPFLFSNFLKATSVILELGPVPRVVYRSSLIVMDSIKWSCAFSCVKAVHISQSFPHLWSFETSVSLYRRIWVLSSIFSPTKKKKLCDAFPSFPVGCLTTWAYFSQRGVYCNGLVPLVRSTWTSSMAFFRLSLCQQFLYIASLLFIFKDTCSHSTQGLDLLHFSPKPPSFFYYWLTKIRISTFFHLDL